MGRLPGPRALYVLSSFAGDGAFAGLEDPIPAVELVGRPESFGELSGVA